MKSRAAIATKPHHELSVEEVEVAPPASNEVLVEIRATGVCHTDAVMLSGNNPKAPFPAILGHEGAGVVRECGPEVRSLVPGDHVIPLYGAECRECRNCTSQKTNLCLDIRATRDKGVMQDGSVRFAAGSTPIHHFMGTSTFANHTVVPEIALAKIRQDAPLERVCLLGCGVTTGIGAAINDAAIRPGQTTAIFGMGAVGLSAVQGARLAGAMRIVAVDINPGKEALARQFGATDFVNPLEVDGRTVECIRDLTCGGVDASIECTGNINVMRDSLECCHIGWGISVLAGVEGRDEEVSLPPVFVRYGRELRGSYFGGVRGRTELPRYVDMYMEGLIDVDSLVSHELPLHDINSAFAMMEQGTSTRCVIKY